LSSDDPNLDRPSPRGTPGLRDFVGDVGRRLLEFGSLVRENVELFLLTLHYAFRGKRDRQRLAEQMFDIGNRSMLFIAVTLGFLGMILIFQAGYQAQRITGDLRMLGPLFLQLLFREFGPTITALMVATRAGTGMAAQLGSMVVTEQIDALRMSAAQPVDYLVVPRFIASTIMLPVLTIFGMLVSFGAGAVTANLAFDVNYYTFVDIGMIEAFDIVIGFTKAFAYGLVIPIVACHAGLNVSGGSAGVGRATTRAVVRSSLSVVFLDFLISGIGYVFMAL
jgi:phospholipid/cholesterol/gamma-HCH transport system permease protein